MLIYWYWSLPDQFWRFLKVFGKFKKSKMADLRWPPFGNKTLLWRHMTSSAEVADLNGNIFGRTIIACHSFNILRVKRWGRNPFPPPRLPITRPKKPGLNIVNMYRKLKSLEISSDVLKMHTRASWTRQFPCMTTSNLNLNSNNFQKFRIA